MRTAFALLLSVAALPCAAGNVYKWKDASGQMHYSQTPPPAGSVSVQPQAQVQPGVTMTAPPAPPAPAATAKPADPKAAPPETKEAKAKRCTDSKERLAFLEERTARRLMIAQPDGSESRMTEEEFAQRVDQAKEAGKGC
ncbi:MAG: DUF4124 domain-containing protein [Stagnimonas sp.]|nr:DUF4124 domain-containing protein [Stagnimonas sp.]